MLRPFLLVLLVVPVVLNTPGSGAAAATRARNVILFLADAGGTSTVAAASLHGYGSARRLFIQRMPHVGLSDTTSASHYVTDSAAGMTATSATSVSAAPPSLLICVNKTATVHDPLLKSRAFCVNILHAWQSELAKAFCSKDVADRFAHGDWFFDERAVPHLSDAQANIFCEVDDVHAYGSHSIVIGKVYRLDVRKPVHPLVYQDGRYTVGLAEGVDGADDQTIGRRT